MATECPPNRYYPHLSVEEYWEFLQINECAAWGIRNYPDQNTAVTLGCGDYWNQESRYFLAASLEKAVRRLKSDRWLGFPVRREYFPTRQLDYNWPVYLGKYVRGVGVEASAVIESGKAITLSVGGTINEPVSFTVTVDFTDIDELVVYYPGTTCLIRPSSVSISGTTATVEIPRCRLLKATHHKNYKNDQLRPDYEDDTNFVSSVDVYRNYLDTSTGSNLVWWRHAGQLSCINNNVWTCNPQGACSDVKQLACPYVKSQRDGFVQLEPATYSGGYSKAAYAVSRKPDGVEVTYMRGYYDRYEEIDAELKRAIIALAHNNLPRRYCSCDVQTLWYENDTKPLEPAVRMKSGQSTWGLYEAEMIIREFDKDRNSHNGGML